MILELLNPTETGQLSEDFSSCYWQHYLHFVAGID